MKMVQNEGVQCLPLLIRRQEGNNYREKEDNQRNRQENGM